MSLHLQPVAVTTDSRDAEGLLVFHRQSLTAVLVRLSDDHEDEAGKWFLEAGFGLLETPHAPTFADLNAAQDWILGRLNA